MDVLSESINYLLQNFGLLPTLLLVYFVGLLIFWFECKLVEKQSHSIFDLWFISTVISLLIGRITYLLGEWDRFSEWYWFWLPYEKYGDEVFFFRAMPWRLLSLWDGGFLIISMFLTFIISGYLYIIWIKRWRWKDMLVPLLVPANFMMSTFLLVYGVFLHSDIIGESGLNLLAYTISFQLLLFLLKVIYSGLTPSFLRLSRLLTTLFLIGDIVLISYTFLSQPISTVERYHIYAFIIYGIFMLAVYIYDVNRTEPTARDDDYDGPKHSITLNQAIKITRED